MKHIPIFVTDTETTGLAKPALPASGVVSFAYAELNSEMHVVKERLELVNPGCPIEFRAMEVHGITEDMVADKPPLEDLYKMEGPIYFVAHNAKFDFVRLSHLIDNCVGRVCTMEAAKRFLTGQPNNKLVTLVKHFGLESHDAHNALGDVRMTVGLLHHILKVSGLTFLELAKAMANPKIPTEMPFGLHKGKVFADIPLTYINFVLGLEDLDAGLRRGLEMQRKVRGCE